MQDFIFGEEAPAADEDALEDLLYAEKEHPEVDFLMALEGAQSYKKDLSRFCLKRFVPQFYAKPGCLTLTEKNLQAPPRKDVLKFLKIGQDDPTPPAVEQTLTDNFREVLAGVLLSNPVVTFRRLTAKLKAQNVQFRSVYALKKELCQLCYLFSGGPFKNAFIRRGYDPRVDPESVKWQVFSVEVKGKEDQKFSSKSFESVQIEEVSHGRLESVLTVDAEEAQYSVC